MYVTIFYSLSYRIWVVQFLFSEVYNSFAHCLNLVLLHYGLLSFPKRRKAVRFTLLHTAWSNISSLRINKFCLHQSSWWLCRLRRVTKFCLLWWDLPIILWVTFRAHSLLFFTGKIAFANLKNLFSLICGFRFQDSGVRFRILVSDSGLRFPGFRVALNHNREALQLDRHYILHRWKRSLKDWLNLFVVSVSATASAAIFEKFLLSRHY